MAISNPWSQRLREGAARMARHDSAYAYKREIGNWIRELREKRGLTQVELSELVDVFFTMISAIETGRNAVPPERYKRFAKHLHVPEKDFAMKMLRWSNPWLFEMLFGADDRLKAELAAIPERVQKNRQRRRRDLGLDSPPL
jgi:transcriptional regulator with XRE-family HTH domain